MILNKFELDCPKIKLTQQIKENPIVYSGPGTIYQDKNGMLQLKVYHSIKDIKKEISHQLVYYTPGKIISDEHYFLLEATDMSGTTWFSENVWVTGNISFPTLGHVIKTSLKRIKNKTKIKERKAKKNYLHMIVPSTDFSIPGNASEELPKGSWRRNITKINIQQLDLELRLNDNSFTIKAISESKKLDEELQDKLLEALSIIFGKIVKPIIFDFIHNGYNVSAINSISLAIPDKSLLSPIKHSNTTDLQSFKDFLERYIITVGKPNSQLFGYWYNVYKAWDSSIENRSLVLSVTIEGITKTYLKKYSLPDKELLQQSQEAAKIIQKMDLHSRIKQRILSNLGELKNISTKTTLYKMADKSLFPKFYVDEWVKLRNKSAHPANLGTNEKEIQKFLDQIHISLTFFYLLLFLIIGYQGKYVDFSKEGWPVNDFKIKKS